VVRGKPWLRSIHRERASRVIEPRNESARGGRRGFLSGGSSEVPSSPGTEPPPGSESTAHTYRGSPGTWEVLSFPPPQTGWAPGPDEEPGPHFDALDTVGSERTSARWYRRAKETKREGDGRQEVGAPHRTCEVGEPTRGTRRRERGAGLRNHWRERCREHRVPKASQRDYSG
jgi:hypothetical protein